MTVIRLARAPDAPAFAAIYAPIVASTYISFETDPPDENEMARRVEKTLAAGLPWLVYEQSGCVAGYAYASRHRERAGYRWSVETSVYVDRDWRGRGFGQALYRSLLAILAAQGYRNVYAGIALPNPASVRVHEAVGFRHIGVFSRIGYKLGAWRDVSWWQLALSSDDAPGEVRGVQELHASPDWSGLVTTGSSRG